MLHYIEKLSVFPVLMNMTLTGSVIILFVLLARLCLRRTPKVYSYVLWAVVLFRLLCPVSFTAQVSALNLVRPEVTATTESVSLTMYVANTPAVSQTFASKTELPSSDILYAAHGETKLDTMAVFTVVWAMGFAGMAFYGLAGFLRLHRKLIGAVKVSPGVFLADGIDMPFVLGILHPRIYLPNGIPIAHRPLILAHERYHIRRLDMLWKLLMFLALCLHWFNPLVWLAFVLAGKDMEMSCDEAVLQKLDKGQRADYAAALLRLTAGKSAISGIPLAFGEGDTKGRIKNMVKWKKPKVWVSILCLLMCIGIAVVFLTNPRKEIRQEAGDFELIVGSRYVYSIHVTTPKGSGTGQHADNSLYSLGEKVYLETITDLDSLSGVTIEAYGEDGVLIWGFSVPENIEDVLSVNDGSWQVLCKSRTIGYFSQLTAGPSGIGFGEMNFRIPNGINGLFAFRESRGHGDYTFLAGNEKIGGVRSFKMEAEPDRFDFDWIKDLPLPEWKTENIGYFSDSGADGSYSIEFFSDVPEGVERTVLNEHFLHYYNGYLYDVWFDKLKSDSFLMDQILDSVEYSTDSVMYSAEPDAELSEFKPEHALTESPSEDWLGFEISEFYSIGPLPGEYHYETGGDLRILNQENTVVGNITAYPIPLNTYDPEDSHFAWLERNRISDFGNINLFYEGGMSFSYNRWMARFTGDNPRVERYHFFQVSGNYVFDICFDGLLVNFDTQQALLAAFQLKAPDLLPDAEHTVHSQSDEEETAYQTIASFLNALQKNTAAYVVQNREPLGASAPNAKNSYYYFADGNRYCNETEILPDGKIRETAKIMAEDEGYYGERNETTGEWTWSVYRGEYPAPWIGSIDWNRQTFQYLGTTERTDGTSYLYHSDLWFEEDEGGYFVDFYFDGEGRFGHVNILVNMYEDNYYEVTEMILGTDAKIIQDWIDIEYQKAIG